MKKLSPVEDTFDVQAHKALAGESRVAILAAVRATRHPATINELAEAVGLHVNTVRGHLEVLVDAGLVHRTTEQRHHRRGRPRVLFTSPVITEQHQRQAAGDGFRVLAGALANHLEQGSVDVAAEAERAGAAWGETLHAWAAELASGRGVDGVVRLLERAGFAPRVEGQGDRVRLTRCPYGRLAREHREVVCGVHLGVLRGALHAAGSSVTITELHPFVDPPLCVLDLAPGPRRPVEERDDLRSDEAGQQG